MKYVVKLSDEADADLRKILRYIAEHLQLPGTAVRQLQRLEQYIRGLGEFPHSFHKYERGVWKKRGLRVMPVDRYCVFYIPDDDAETVTVVRVMYGGRNIARWLEEKQRRRSSCGSNCKSKAAK